EFLLEHGMLDAIVPRKDLKAYLHRALTFLEPTPMPTPASAPAAEPLAAVAPVNAAPSHARSRL
ncbi:MAG: hypothetical protein ACRD2D_11060, partial [Terriglobales bacterium]